MIILTGAAGFIGSCFLQRLNQASIDKILIVDDLTKNKEKEKNLQGKKFKDYIHKDEFIKKAEQNKLPTPEFVIHMGACSSTTLAKEDYYRKNNLEYSKTLALWAYRQGVVFQYASSAATYGDGGFGYDDDNSITRTLQPLNFYGKYKQLFDLWILDNGFENKSTGIKFFNVFGPNEYHKGEMMSVICKKFRMLRDEGRITLFKSYRDDYRDGEQKRDFVYIKDTVEVMYYFFLHPDATGIFNLGTGCARSWNDVANAMFRALNMPPRIDYIEMPAALRPNYQYFTEAKMDKLRTAGCRYQFRTLEDSVKDYATYLNDHAYL